MIKFLTFEEQVDNLIDNKKLIVDDRDKAILFFKKYNYYYVSGYHINFRRNDIFNKGITINNIYNAFFFDMELRRILLPLCETYENMLKTKIAYYFAKNHDPFAYDDINNFDFSQFLKKKPANKTEDEYKREILDDIFLTSINYLKENHEAIYNHFNNEYNGKFPIWTVIMTMTFGNVTKLYEILLKADKSCIAYYFLENETLSANELSNYSKCICSLRNKCAHFDRLYDKNFTKMACFDSMIKRNLIKEKLNPNKIGYTLYGYLVILARIFKINKTVWTSFLNNLYELLVFYNTVSLIKNYGFSGSAWYKNINMDINLYNKIISIDNKTINLENIDIIKSKFY